MAKIRDILVSVAASTAINKRKCHRTQKHSISAGGTFLLIKNSGSLGSKNYCTECANKILDSAIIKIESIKKMFNPQ